MTMQRVTTELVDAYLREDSILGLLNETTRPGDDQLTCHRWLRDVPAKRFIFHQLYGDLIAGPRRRILDVGGGLTSITRVLAARHDYTLVDIMAHDSAPTVRRMMDSFSPARVVVKDWRDAELEGRYDVVIANDLFPNVDQRLDLFLGFVIPRADEIRLALTYYNEPRFYFAKRLDADEVFCVLAWDGRTTLQCMSKYERHLSNPDFALFLESASSPFANRRQVCLACLHVDETPRLS